MLQNPSKYHPNPLSHFLALHNSQSAHNARPHVLPTTATGHQFHQHHSTIMANHHHTHHLNSPHPHAHLIDATNTSLDVGKSFTIAAILGLQKSAIESNRKEYNNVINLSLNSSNSNHHSHHSHHQLPALNEMDKGENNIIPANNTCNSNNNNSSSNKSSGSNSYASVNSFNCDSNAAISSAALVNRYLPTVNTSSASSFVASVSHQQTLASSQVHASSFAAAAAVAAAAAANAAGSSGPSALQSLQQLHQHHAQQASLSFQREKLKADSNGKKSSLKNKRVRTIFTPEQLERLEAEFERQQYMVGPERLYLAHTLQLTEAQVKVWFQNRRIKWRKHHLEITQQRLALLRQSQVNTTIGTAAATSTAALISPPSCEEGDEIKHSDEIRQMGGSRQASESDLSICNDSMDADSVIDGGEET